MAQEHEKPANEMKRARSYLNKDTPAARVSG